MTQKRLARRFPLDPAFRRIPLGLVLLSTFAVHRRNAGVEFGPLRAVQRPGNRDNVAAKIPYVSHMARVASVADHRAAKRRRGRVQAQR